MLPLSPFYKWGYWSTKCLNSNPLKVTQLGCKVLIQIFPIHLQSPRSWLLSTWLLKFYVNIELIIQILEWYSFFEIKGFHRFFHISKESQMESIAHAKCLSLALLVEASTIIWNDAVIWCQVGCSQSVTRRIIPRWPIVLQMKRWF